MNLSSHLVQRLLRLPPPLTRDLTVVRGLRGRGRGGGRRRPPTAAEHDPGTGEPRASAVTLVAADQQVFHDPDHSSAIVLPVRTAD